MIRDERAKIVERELMRIPLGDRGSPQEELRTMYAMARGTGLATDEHQPRGVAFAQAVASVRTLFPEFEPALVDPAYFAWGYLRASAAD